MKANKLVFVGMLAGASVASIGTLAEDKNVMHKMTPATEMAAKVQPAVDGELSSLGSATEWLISQPLTAAGLRGKVVLIDVWTYTCINWLRTVPYVRAWAEKYKDHGLVVIGVHAPEFPFERDVDNVRRAVKDMGLTYPIAIDNDFAIWRAFKNQGWNGMEWNGMEWNGMEWNGMEWNGMEWNGMEAWPALFFVDAQGRTRHHHFGEGDYERSERLIQQLLTEAGARGAAQDLVSVDARGAEAAADWASLKSPETYVGYGQAERFVPPGGVIRDRSHLYAANMTLRLNQWTLSGDWTVQKGAAAPSKSGGRIAYRFHARDLNLVMGSAARGTSMRFRVLIDGKPPGAAHGTDIDDQGVGTVVEQRLYQLIRQPKPIADRLFEIEFLDPGAEVYAFTFG